MKIKKSISTVLVAVASLVGFTNPTEANTVEFMMKGNCAYSRDGLISVSKCQVSMAISESVDFGRVVMQWDDGSKVVVNFNPYTREAVINGKEGQYATIDELMCFITNDGERICTDAQIYSYSIQF